MNTTSIRWRLAVGTALLAQFALIVISVLCVAVYSYAIRTGETQEFYNAFAMQSGPWISLIAGGPVFFVIARWIRRRAGAATFRTTMAQLGLYFAIEAAVFLLWSGEIPAMPWALVIAGSFLKVVGAWTGAGGVASPPQAMTT